jgi:glycerol-3-phosphate O-acyltransferase
VLVIVAYEFLRASVLRGIRLRLERSVSRYLSRNRVRLDRFKFTDKHFVREAILNDRSLTEYMLQHSHDTGQPIEDLRRRSETYIEEIVPFFNLVSYYKIGFGVARRLMATLYDVVAPREHLRADAAEGDATVYVINHRSNADYVLLAVAMAREVALSYAVGEWARIWPLEGLFKSFGSYFVRRGEADPLYHQVLRRYILLVTAGGMTQGFFLEGKLTRTGSLGGPKLGLLENLFGAFDQGFEGDVRFVPVGLNFDRVLEDSRLLAEGRGETRAPGLLEKVRSLLFLVLTIPPTILYRAARLLRGAWRLARGRHFSFGVAAVHAGPSLGFREFFGDRLDAVRVMDRQERKAELQGFGDELLRRIAEQVPVTSVPLFAAALERSGAFEQSGASREAVLAQVTRLLRAFRHVGAPVLLGPEFASLAVDRAEVASRPDAGSWGLAGLEQDLIGGDEAAAVWRLARSVLARRHVLEDAGAGVRVAPEGHELVRYYLRSIEPHLARVEAAGEEAFLAPPVVADGSTEPEPEESWEV